jgi:transitional endoplasmic reticulum ATPase
LQKIPPPDEQGRLEILKIHTKKMLLEKDVDLKRIAKKTEGWSGADLQNLCIEAGYEALRENQIQPIVKQNHFETFIKKTK